MQVYCAPRKCLVSNGFLLHYDVVLDLKSSVLNNVILVLLVPTMHCLASMCIIIVF